MSSSPKIKTMNGHFNLKNAIVRLDYLILPSSNYMWMLLIIIIIIIIIIIKFYQLVGWECTKTNQQPEAKETKQYWNKIWIRK